MVVYTRENAYTHKGWKRREKLIRVNESNVCILLTSSMMLGGVHVRLVRTSMNIILRLSGNSRLF